MKNGMIGFALLLCASISCSAQNFEYKSEINDKKASNDSKDAKASADESASVPAIVTGSYLFCEELESSNTLERKVACNAFDQDDNLLSLEDEARDWQWSAKGLNGVKSISVEEFSQGPHQAIFTISQFTADQSTFTAALDITFNDDRSVSLESEIVILLENLSGRRFIRAAVTSIHVNDGINEVVPYETIEFKLNGQWMTVEASIQGFSPLIEIGPYTATIENANLADLQMFFDLMNGGEPEITEDSSFSQIAPYNNQGDPIYLVVDFGDDNVKVQGIRFNGGAVEIPKENLATGSLDVYYFEWSDDGSQWIRINGGTVDLEKNPDLSGNFEIPIY